MGKSFISGGNKFFADTKTNLEVKGLVTHAAGNYERGSKYGEIMQFQAGTNNPVVVEYFIGGGRGHFSPVTEFHIRQGSATHVDVKTLDHRDRYYSLTGSWGTERGAFYLVNKTR